MNVYGVTGWKNSGKTGLMERLVTHFCAEGWSVSTIKHAHHAADTDAPGRDTHRHRMAGAREVILATPDRWALMHEVRDAPEPGLAALVARLAPVDLVLVEGYKSADHPKIEAHLAVTGRAPLAPEMRAVRAVASDAGLTGLPVPVLPLDDTAAIAAFIRRDLGT